MPEGGLPVMSSDGGPEMSPRESMDTSGALPSANSSAGHRRSVGEALISNSFTSRSSFAQVREFSMKCFNLAR